MWPLLVPVGRGGASGKALPFGAAPRAGGADAEFQTPFTPGAGKGGRDVTGAF
jgi:hypothetical protein